MDAPPRIDHWLEEELLFSVLARCQQECAVIDPRVSLAMIFGSTTLVPSADLPSGLDSLFRRVGQCAGFQSVETMIARSTLYPYFTFFMPPDRREAALWRARSLGGGGLKVWLGLVANGFGASAVLRHCTQCASEYCDRFGVAPWLRAHQLPGVTVCAKHRCMLIAQPPQSRLSHRQRLALPDLKLVAPTPLPTSEFASMLKFARISASLLSAGAQGQSMPMHAAVYREALQRNGLVRGISQISWERLRQRLVAGSCAAAWFPYRARLQLHASEVPSWVRTALGGRVSAVHPICHIALIEALFPTPDDFLSQSRYVAQGNTAERPANADGRELLESWLRDTSLSCREVARRADLTPTTISLRRKLLGISLAQESPGLDSTTFASLLPEIIGGNDLSEVASRHQISTSWLYRALFTHPEVRAERAARLLEAARVRNREAWLMALKGVPNARVAELRTKAGAAYAWLRRHDSEWLKQNLPSARLRAAARPRVNWATRDENLAKLVPAAAEEIKAKATPTRATPNEILLRVYPLGSWHRHRGRLPRLQSTLLMHSETLADFLRRRRTAQP